MGLSNLFPALLLSGTFSQLLSSDSPHLHRSPRVSMSQFANFTETQSTNDAVNMSGILGYANVTEVLDDGSSLFWWFISRLGGDVMTDTTPLVLWLQGGPGCSSIIGAFFEFGPLAVTDDLQLVARPGSWAEQYHLLFVDNPFGAGYSFTTDPNNYVTNEYEVGKYVYILLQKLIVKHPEFFRRDLYIFGQSYGGKYVPAVAYYILNWNANTTATGYAEIPLRGIGIGDGITDPVPQLTTFSDFAFAAALIDESERAVVTRYEKQLVQLVEKQQWLAAWNVTKTIVAFISQQAGNVNVYNFREFGQYNFTTLQLYFNSSDTKAILNLPASLPFSVCHQMALDALETDIMQSLVWMMPYLFNHTRVLIYNGQDDIFLNTIGFENWIAAIPWYGQAHFRQVRKLNWYADGAIAGYVKTYANLTQVNVLKSGHMVPLDQLQNSLDMLTRFITSSPWD